MVDPNRLWSKLSTARNKPSLDSLVWTCIALCYACISAIALCHTVPTPLLFNLRVSTEVAIHSSGWSRSYSCLPDKVRSVHVGSWFIWFSCLMVQNKTGSRGSIKLRILEPEWTRYGSSKKVSLIQWQTNTHSLTQDEFLHFLTVTPRASRVLFASWVQLAAGAASELARRPLASASGPSQPSTIVVPQNKKRWPKCRFKWLHN